MVGVREDGYRGPISVFKHDELHIQETNSLFSKFIEVLQSVTARPSEFNICWITIALSAFVLVLQGVFAVVALKEIWPMKKTCDAKEWHESENALIDIEELE